MSKLTQDSTAQTPTSPPPPAPPHLTPPRREPRDQVFRRTFLARFYRPDQVTALEGTGDALAELLNEAGWWGPIDDEELAVREVKAVAEDAELLGSYLAELAAERYTGALGREITLLCEQADNWAGRLLDLAEEMRGVLVPLLSDEVPS